MFERPFHQRIAQVLGAFNGTVLKEHNCLFGGGTVIALRFGEYRESVDIDFLLSDVTRYQSLRQLLKGADGINAILLPGQPFLTQLRDIRADQYGIRTMISVEGQPIKFEIILEGRIELAAPTAKDVVCGISTPSVGSVPDLGQEFMRLTREFKIQETLVELLTKQFEMTKLAEVKDVTGVQVIQKAVPSDIKAKPKRAIKVIMATFMACLTAVVWALLSHRRQQMTVEEVQRWRHLKDIIFKPGVR